MKRLAVLIVGLALVGAACSSSSKSKSTSSGSPAPKGSGSSSPAGALTDAFTKTSEGSGRITLSLFGSAADFNAMSASGQSSTSKKDLALADKLIPTSSVAIAFDNNTSNPAKSAFELSVSLDNSNDVDLIVVNDVLYLKVDVQKIGSATGADTSKLTSQASSISAMIPGLSDLLAGKFVSLDLKQLRNLVPNSGSTATTGAPVGSPAQLRQLIAAVQSALVANSTVTKVGSDSVGDHYKLSVQLKGFVQAVYPQLQALAGPAASLAGGNVQKSLDKIPATPVTVDTWINGGKVKQVELDARQFQKTGTPPPNPVGLKIAFSDLNGSIGAPSGATPIDLSKVSSLLGGLLNKASG